MKNWLVAGSLILVLGNAFCLLGVFFFQSCDFLRVVQTHHDFHQLGRALHQYHDLYGSFPPAVLRDESGKPMHSWRSMIEPQLFDGATDHPSAPFFMGEPWDSPANLRAKHNHRHSRHPYQFLAIVGPDAAWISDGSLTIRDMQDGTSDTILAIAIPGTDVGWHEPRDLEFDGATVTLNGKPFSLSRQLFVLWVDGTVQNFANGIPPEYLKAWVTRDAGDKPASRY